MMSKVIQSIKEKLRVQFNALLTDDEKAVLKEYHAKLEESLKPIVLEKKEAKTKEGVTVSWEGELKEGAILNVTGADGMAQPAPDGPHELEDGTIVTVEGGLVKEVKAPQAAAPAPDAEMQKTLEAKFSAQKTELEKMFEAKFAAKEKELTGIIDELKKVQLSTLSTLDKILNMPVDTITEADATVKKYEDMTAAEKVKFNRGKL